MATIAAALDLAYDHSQAGHPELAEAIYRRVLAVEPNAHVAYNLGTVLTRQGKFEEAIDAYRQAIALKPDFVEAYNNLAMTLHQEERFDESVDCCRAALALREEAEVYNNLGLSLMQQGLIDEALECFQRALKLEPQHLGAWHNFSYAVNFSAKWDSAAIGAELRRLAQVHEAALTA